MGLLSSVALLLTIIGGVQIGDNTSGDDVSKINSGNNLRHIGVILFAVQFALTVLVTFFMWSKIRLIMKHRRTVRHFQVIAYRTESLTVWTNSC